MAMQTISFQLSAEVLERLHARVALEGRDEEAILLEAVNGYLTLQEQRDVLTCEAIEDVDRHGVIPHEDVLAWSRTLGTSRPATMPEPRMTSNDPE